MTTPGAVSRPGAIRKFEFPKYNDSIVVATTNLRHLAKEETSWGMIASAARGGFGLRSFKADAQATRNVERQNLTMHMSMRRFTRLTNAFLKKPEHHALSVALHCMHYNFCRIHKTLQVTPAMAAGVRDRPWDVSDVATLIVAQEAPVAKRGPYKKKVAWARPSRPIAQRR